MLGAGHLATLQDPVGRREAEPGRLLNVCRSHTGCHQAREERGRPVVRLPAERPYPGVMPSPAGRGDRLPFGFACRGVGQLASGVRGTGQAGPTPSLRLAPATCTGF